MEERILIVDDEPDTVELLRYNLEQNGYSAVIARTGKEAIDAAQCVTPELVLLDVLLPELNGWDVCRMLRESPMGKAVPIIMISALAEEEARVKGLSAGADDYITKPFSVKELLLKIGKLVDRKHEVRRLRTREQEQDTSLRYLVHELKNAMTALGGLSSISLRKDRPLLYFEAIKSSALHAENLLKDADLLLRLELGDGLAVRPIDVPVVMREVTNIFQGAACEKGIEIVTINSTSDLVMGNETGVRQILMNLVSNAVKYNRYHGRVWVYFEESGPWTDVSITDEGCGILERELSMIFDKFYRGEAREKVGGAGLGLYIVRLLTAAMGGKISVLSNPCAGSTFTLSLPRAPTPRLDACETIDKRTIQSA